MRLICPNCATQYEVDDSAVPAAGREVQCGSCASTWFQAPARSNVTAASAKGDLPKWVEDIVEDDGLEEARELPGSSPDIASEPNEDIIHEPDLEELIDEGALEAKAGTPEPAPTPSKPAPGTSPAAASVVGGAAVGSAIAAKLSGADKEPRQAAQAVAPQAEAPQAQTPQAEAPQTETPQSPTKEATPDVDLSSQLEAAIREQPTTTKDDFAALAAAEKQASEAAEHAAIKAAEHAAAVELAEKTAVRQATAAADLPEKSIQDDIAAEIEGALESLDAGTPLPSEPHEERLSDYDLTEGTSGPAQSGVHTTALRTGNADADAAIGETPEVTEMEEFVRAATDQTAVAEANSGADDAQATTAEPDTAKQDTAKQDTADAPESAMLEAIEKDTQAEQTETLAAKLKARVAEAAKAQESSTVGTAGVLLGASAAGIAAGTARRPTAFPKRETEDLASSLRPKPVDGASLKPRLRPAATPEPSRSRFGQGFFLAVALFVVMVAIYLLRDQIATAIPALAAPLETYAGVIDNVRLVFQDAIGQLTGATADETAS